MEKMQEADPFVLDARGRELRPLDIVRCVDEISGCITLNLEYRVESLRAEEFRIVIKPDDRNLEGWYAGKRFELVLPGEDF
jgi:hypothetical protein